MVKPKIVFIEPNLKIVHGHGFSVIYLLFKNKKIISKYFSAISFCGHKKADSDVMQKIKELKRICAKSCFETKVAKDCFLYLENYIKKYDLKQDDLIVFTTAHINEMLAVFKFISKHKESPRFLLHLHQFFPPLKNSNMINLSRIKAKYEKVFINIFDYFMLYQNKVIICVTPVEKFQNFMQFMSKFRINKLAVPFIAPSRKFKRREYISFIGDGRKEKGLLIALKSFLYLSIKYPEEKFYIQIYRPRGFSKNELKNIYSMCKILKNKANVYVQEQNLNEIKYEKIIDNSKLIFLPYDFDNYRIRFSGVACEAVMRNIPIIFTKGSSIEFLIKKYKTPHMFVKWNKDASVVSRDIFLKFDNFFKKCDNTKGFLNRLAIKDYSINNYIHQIISLFYEQSINNSGNSIKKQASFS